MRGQRFGKTTGNRASASSTPGSMISFSAVVLLFLFSVLLATLPDSSCFAQTPNYPNYMVDGQVLSVDYYGGLHVASGNLDSDDQPELLVITDGKFGLEVYFNHSSSSHFRLERLLDESGGPAIPWDQETMGSSIDAVFLDLLPVHGGDPRPFGDGIDDHLFVAVGSDVFSRQDRLYRIDTAGGISFSPRLDDFIPTDAHNSQTVISTDLGTEDELYLILAGGYYGMKSSPTQPPDLEMMDELRILKYFPTAVEPEYPSPGFYDETATLFPGSGAMKGFLTDLDVVNADSDNKADDLVVSVYRFHGASPQLGKPQVLIFDEEAGPEGEGAFVNKTQFYLTDAPDDRVTWGAVAGHFQFQLPDSEDDPVETQFLVFLYLEPPNQDVRPEVFRHYVQEPGECPDDSYPDTDPRVEHSCFKKVEGAIVWSCPKPANSGLCHGCFDNTMFEGAHVRDKYVVLAGQYTRVLEVDSSPSENPSLSEIDLIGDMGLSSPLAQHYTSHDLLVQDLNQDGAEDIVLTNANEQNRLWEGGFGPGAADWRPSDDITNDYFPADGNLSKKLLVKHLPSDEVMVVAVNDEKTPEVYRFNADYQTHISQERTYEHFHFNNGHPGCADAAAAAFGVGGVDGVLFDIAPGDLALAVAGERHYNQLYEWKEVEVDPGVSKWKFVFDDDHSLVYEFLGRTFNLSSLGVSAGDLDGDADGYDDLIFANSDILHGLEILYNQNGSFDNVEGKREIISGFLETYTAVHVTDFDPPAQNYILAGMSTLSAEKIVVFRYPKVGGEYQRILACDPELELGLLTLAQGFIPMNLDNSPAGLRDDYFVPTKGGGNNFVLRYTGGDCPFEMLPISLNASCDPLQVDNISGGAAYNLDNDDFDDLVVANQQISLGDTSGTRIYLNEWDPQSPGACVVMNDVTAEGAPDHPLVEGYRVYDFEETWDALIVDIFTDEDDMPEIFLAADGQNRLLIADSDRDGIHDHCDSDPDGPGVGDSDGDGYGDECECDDTDASVYPNAPENCPDEPWVGSPDYADNSCEEDAGYCKINEGCSDFRLLAPAFGSIVTTPEGAYLAATAGPFNYFRTYLSYDSISQGPGQGIQIPPEPDYLECTYPADPDHGWAYWTLYSIWEDIADGSIIYWSMFGANSAEDHGLACAVYNPDGTCASQLGFFCKGGTQCPPP